ncbi:hypothetical protein B0H12DRAFT_99519 [Mycena haematopus]|nr:hypothetical protein B0H12DRAFT_99519 [Mycena haematopus]
MTLNSPDSLLEVFIAVASNPATASRSVLECGSHAWTYAELDTVSNALADELKEALGCVPKVASVVENHPYVLALMLAIWKLDGIFIPLDPHVPATLLQSMLGFVKPTAIVLLASDIVNHGCVAALNIHILPFNPETSTIPAMNQKYAKQNLDRVRHRPPHPDHPCLYLFTSSITSPENLKAVPLTHGMVLRGCNSKLAWWRRMQLGRDLDGIRVLGWAPWSHVLSHMQDIGTATLLNAGCYVFASVPVNYASTPESDVRTDLTAALIAAILHKNVSAFACLPFILSSLKVACEGSHPANVALLRALRSMLMLECGGALLDRELCDWAAQNDIPVFVGIGMTEIAGAIFAGRAEDTFSGFGPQNLIPDVQLSLLGDQAEGELVVNSKSIPHGYINYDDGSFSVSQDGVVTFRTGDRYHRTEAGKFVWVGRTTDFIQMDSGETLDPRPIQRALRASKIIRNACVIGDAFLRRPSRNVCAIIELETAPDTNTLLLDEKAVKLEVARILAPINRDLLPAVRIAWSSILILDKGQTIPMTTKGEVFRKKIEGEFGTAIEVMRDAAFVDSPPEQVADTLAHLVGTVLGVSDADMLNSMSFAEMGMTSLLAIKIAEALNKHLHGRLVVPSNICYIHLDLPSLVGGIADQLAARSSPQPATDIRETFQLPNDAIVIVGKAFRLPGAIHTDAALWDALLGKTESVIADIPPDRWDHASFLPHDINFCRAGLVDVASYDYGFFGLTATEAFYLSPTMRLALEVAFEALEDANIPIARVRGSKMAVYVATKDDGFETLLNAAQGYDAYTRFYGTGRAPSTASGRINYLLDVHGPSVTIDTACSGGIVCIDQAVAYLQSGAAESAIVCSSNTHCWPGSFMFLTAQGMVSPNSRCATFTSEADGYVPSEGAVAFILKTQRAAIRDKDRILATILGTEVAHNGKSQGLAAPNMKAQVALHRSVLRKARLDSTDIDFVETHGTGTSLGDLCEIQGINEAFSSSQSPSREPLILGASKSALGHTECSAGLVGILSVLLSFEKGLVPGLVHLQQDNLNPGLDCTSVPLLIPTQPVPMPTERPLRALVMSYGFSGTLAEIALESPAPLLTRSEGENTGPMIFVLSAKTSAALEAYISTYLTFLKCADPHTFHQICYTSCVGREHYTHRLACVATDLPDLIRQLEYRQLNPSRSVRSSGSLAFAFPGQGTQFPAMAAALAGRYSKFGDLVRQYGGQARILCDAPIDAILLDSTTEISTQGRSDISQICIFIYQYSLCRWLRELGIKPRAVIGHSLGEITAAVVAGAMPFDVGLDLVITRARLLRPPAESPGGMAALACSEANVSRILASERSHFTRPITVSVINGPQSVAVSGTAQDIDTLVAIAKDHNIKVTRLNVDQGFHSPYVDGALPGLRNWSAASSALFTPLKIDLYSSLMGSAISSGQTLPSEHWVDHTRQPVLFAQAATAIQEAPSVGTILDIGPQTVAWSLLLSNGHSGRSTLALSAKKGEDQEIAFLAALAALFQNHGIIPDFGALYSQRSGSFETISIPTYPFQRVRRYPSYVPSRHKGAANSSRSTEDTTDLVTPEHHPVINPPAKGMNPQDLRAALTRCVRDVLEIGTDGEFDDSESLGLRIDSIAFAQLRKRIEDLCELNVSIVFWSDVFSIADMINALVEEYVDEQFVE